MISSEHLNKICTEYSIGESIDVKEILEGSLNHNYILETTKGKYFIKSVRDKKKQELQYVFDVEKYMKSEGISAVTMLKIQDDKFSLELDGDVYTLYEYVESDRSHTYSLSEYQDMGALLARIHGVGSKAVPEKFQERQFKMLSRPRSLERLEGYKKEIFAKAERTDIDTLFLKYINLKNEEITKLGETKLSPNTTLIHGDYHQGNLLISKDTRQIIGVCDWEQSLMAPRAYELSRSIMYICFDEGFDIETSTERAQAFMKGYNSVFPISIEELSIGFDMRLERTLTATWIEEGYFLRGDTRANKFIQHEIDLTNLFYVNKFEIEKIFKN